MKYFQRRGLVIGAVSLATLGSVLLGAGERVASAHGGDTEAPAKNARGASTTTSTTTTTTETRHTEEHEEHEPRFDIGIDAVIGWGDVPALNFGLPASLDRGTPSSIDRTKVEVDSYIVGAGFRFADNLRAFVHLPVVHATLNPDNGLHDERSISNIGNVEIGAGMTAPEDAKIAFLPKLALALPTSSGKGFPPVEEVKRNPTGDYERPARDYYSSLLAANASRGYEESALFASKHWGITPSLEVRMHAGPAEITPFAAVAILIAATDKAEKRVAGDVVAGVEGAVPVAPFVDLALRAFVNVPFDKEERSDSYLGVLEPQVRFHLGPLSPYAGFLIPLLPVGTRGTDVTTEGVPTIDPRYPALRLGAIARW